MEVRHDAEEYEARLADIVGVVRDTIRRRWITLVVVTLVVTALGVALTFLLTPQYSATAEVRLDPSRAPLASTATNGAPQVKPDMTPEAVQTEISAVTSLEVARAIVRSHHLGADPEYTKGLSKLPPPALNNPDLREIAVANALLGQLTVTREVGSYVLDITVKDPNPVRAAVLANAFADGYLQRRAAGKLSLAREQANWFNERLAALGGDANRAEARAAEFRAKAGIIQSDQTGGTIIDQQVAPLSGSLASAQSDAAAAASNYSAARSQVERGDLASVSEVLASPIIADLRSQRTQVLRDMAQVQAHYGDKHPETIRVRDQLARIDAQLQAESQRVVSSLQAAANATAARVTSLTGSLNALESQRERSVQDSASAASLEQEATAKRALYDRMSQLSLDSMQAAGAALAQAEVVQRATPPAVPSFPNKILFGGLALLVGLAAGAGAITAQELLNGGFRSVDTLEAKVGVPVLAVVPRVTKVKKPADLLLDRPTSMFSEAFRIARTAVLGARGDAGVQVIAITSSLPSEGKTTSAVSFARTLAIAGARTMLLECDVRRAAVRELVKGGAPKVGLVELLHGEATLEQVIQAGDVDHLDQILVVEPYFSAENLFGEGRMEKLLDVLRARYDYIVLDLPPLIGLADGRYLAVLADATALVVKWGATPVSAVTAASAWLRNDGGNLIGTMFAQADPNAQSVGGMYYYSKQYAGYYQDA